MPAPIAVQTSSSKPIISFRSAAAVPMPSSTSRLPAGPAIYRKARKTSHHVSAAHMTAKPVCDMAPAGEPTTAAATADWRESHNATASNVLEVRRACYRLSLTPASNRVGAGCPQVQSLRLGSFASRFSCSSRLLASYPRTGEKVMGRSAPVCQI